MFSAFKDISGSFQLNEHEYRYKTETVIFAGKKSIFSPKINEISGPCPLTTYNKTTKPCASKVIALSAESTLKLWQLKAACHIGKP